MIEKIKKYFRYKRFFRPDPNTGAIVVSYISQQLLSRGCKPFPEASVKLERVYGFCHADYVSSILGYIEELEKENELLKQSIKRINELKSQ